MTGLPEVAVLGPGGVGGLLAGLLSRQGVPVTCVATEPTAEVIGREGLTVDSGMFGRWTARPAAVTALAADPAILFVAVKATGLAGALERVDPSSLGETVVIPLMNGLEHMGAIRGRLGRRVAAGSIRVVSMAGGPGRIVHTSPFVVVSVASDGDVAAGRLEGAARLLRECGVETRVGRSEAEVLWEKLVRLAALACATSLTNLPIGAIRADAGRRALLESLVREGVAVARADGVEMTLEGQMSVLDSLPADLTSSTQRDIAAGVPSELDAIAGSVVRSGRARGIDCPVMSGTIDEIERAVRRSGRGH